MDWLNYHHLYYFWVAAREGGIARAAEQLKLAHPTVSKQLHQLEQSLGDKLFKRVGRNLVLTDFGQTVFRYADDIFSVGRELQDAVRGRPSGRPLTLVVGVPNVVPKLICHRLLQPALNLKEPIQLVCREASHDDLLAELSVHRLDLVLSDMPAGPTLNVRVFNHLLGACSVTIFGTPKLATKFRRGFPRSLDGAPLLMPAGRSTVRRDLEQWFYTADVRPNTMAEFEDTALMKVFGQYGLGLFPGPSAVEDEICRQYSVKIVGRLEDVRERYYAISVERRLSHPAVVAMSEAARQELFE